MSSKRKVFISYHHKNDQHYKEKILEINKQYDVFIDRSVYTGDIDESLPDEAIRQKIRDEYLRDSTVTILLVGTETKGRKHIDWELYSSMVNGSVNKKSGVLVIQLPSIPDTRYITVGHGKKEKEEIYPDITSWTTWDRAKYEDRYAYLPTRIIDNVVGKATVSVTNWETISNSPLKLKKLIEYAAESREECEYDLSTPMRKANS